MDSPAPARDRFAWTPRPTPGRPGARRIGAGVLVVYVVLVLWALLHGTTATRDTGDYAFEQTDGGLYRAIVHRMQDGEGYYAAVSAEQPGRGYPTSPVVTVREPTLAWATSVVGRPTMAGVMVTLALVATGLSIWVWGRTQRGRTAWVSMVLLSAAALLVLAVPQGVWIHETWMALLIYLGMLARGLGLVRTSVVLLLLATLVRELAAPVLLLLLVLSWRGGRRREAVTWAAALMVFAAFFALHAVRVGDLVDVQGPGSAGWLALGGWPFVVDAVRETSVLSLLPFWCSALVVPLGVLGWASRSGPLFDHVSLMLLAYAAGFCVVGRPDNAYWGTFMGPFVLPGVVMGVVAGVLAGIVAVRSAIRARHVLRGSCQDAA